MRVAMMLADFAQEINGKLYIQGGGWSVTGPKPSPSAIALKLELPQSGVDQVHRIRLDLLDSELRPVTPPGAQRPLAITGEVRVGRPAGLAAGAPLDIPLALNLGAIPLLPGMRYVWKLTVDGETNDDWQVSFSTRPESEQTPTTP